MSRLTKIVNGTAVLDTAAFPDRAQETLDREMNAFPPFREAVERLAEYEDTGLEPSEAKNLSVKRGHWIINEYDYYDCSVCGEAYFNGCSSFKEAEERLKIRPYDVYSFCPHCGADMRA